MERKNSPLVILYQSNLFALASFLVFNTVLALVMLYDFLIFRIKIDGRENLAACPRAFLISNHSLYLDPAIIAHVINPKRTYFTAMESTFHRGVVGPLIRLLGAFPIPDGAALTGIRKAVNIALDKFGYVHFFPEGVLYHHNQHPKRFKRGVFLLAVRMSIPVIPIALSYTNSGIFNAPRITARVGEAVYPSQFSASGSEREQIAAMAEYTRNRILEMIKSNP